MHRFRHLEVWQLSRALVLETYRLTAAFPASERFGLTSQLRRAAVSVGANIAEGSKRITDRGFAHFLSIAEGSAAEAGFLIDISIELGYLDREKGVALMKEFERLERMLKALRKHLDSAPIV